MCSSNFTYDVDLEKCALLKCVWVCGEWKLNSAPSRTGAGALALKISNIFGCTDKSSLTPVSHCKRERRVSGAEAERMQSRSSARPLPFHTCSVCSARLNSVFCTEWAHSNLILNTIGLDLLLE